MTTVMVTAVRPLLAKHSSLRGVSHGLSFRLAVSLGPLPLITTCLAVASSYDLSGRDITPRDYQPIDTPYDKEQNEEGIAVLDASDLDHARYGFVWSSGRTNIELLELAYGGRPYLDWSMYPNLLVEDAGAALKRRAFDQATAARLDPAFESADREDEHADHHVFAACSNSDHGLAEGALYLSTSYLLVAHQGRHHYRTPSFECFYIADAVCTPGKVVSGFPHYTISLCLDSSGHNGCSGLSAAYCTVQESHQGWPQQLFAGKDLEVADLERFLMLTAPHVRTQELTNALNAPHEDMARAFDECYGHQDGISLTPLCVDEPCDLLNQFPSNVFKVERAAKKAIRDDD
ncbi:hypothetical protein HRG_002532 [Hirsutella rhossiliensis]|uniref:Uncharacterized protein n=1 Tax=Hirsutella rhossiliensis TaxID=111463 RepID=A0A9P8N3S8_9HYPO|nr:uncharacterized protein HRG_02532 [Hirsutella rhossiliensis]KAH0967123.1 hypothetical protein HRG_02532 [Hirsutella rhossiliensis]